MPASTETDEQLMWRVQMQDDPDAFAQIVQRWQSPVRRLCYRMIGDADSAQDLAQETFAKIFLRRREYKPSGKFAHFLWRIATNRCYDELRDRQRCRISSFESAWTEEACTAGDASQASVGPTPAENAIDSDHARLVQEAVTMLPGIYRSVLVLRHYEGLKCGEIAAALDIPEGTVKSRLAEALNRLHQMLAARIAPPDTRNSLRAPAPAPTPAQAQAPAQAQPLRWHARTLMFTPSIP